MTDIAKLLAEAGYEFDARYHRWYRGDIKEPSYIEFDFSTPKALSVWCNDRARLPAILLALQGKAALTEEEREAVRWAEVAALNRSCGTQNIQNIEDYERIRYTLRNLLTRTTADVVSLANVEAAVWSVVDEHGKPEWYDSREEFVQDIMDRLTTKQHHQEGVGEGEGD